MMEWDGRSKFLVVRLSAIGDCIETLPLVCAIHEAFPGAEVDWVVDCGAEQILRMHRGVRRVRRVPKGFLKRPKLLMQLRRELRSEGYGVVIDPQGLFKSGVLAWLTGAKCRIGFGPPQARERAWWFYHHAVAPKATHLVDRQLELLGPLGVTVERGRFDLQARPEDMVWLRGWLGEVGLEERGYVLLNPGAGWASRRWPPERFGELGRRLGSESGIRSVVLWGGRDEGEVAERIAGMLPDSILVAPDTNLCQLAAMIQGSRLMVTGDTGPMHLAAALGVSTVSMFGTTRAEYSGPYGENHIRLQKRYQSGTSRQRRSEGNEAMCEISVDEVLKACRGMLTQG